MRLGLKTERKNNRKAQIKLELKLLNPVTASATIKTSRTTLDNYATKSLFFGSTFSFENEGTRVAASAPWSRAHQGDAIYIRSKSRQPSHRR